LFGPGCSTLGLNPTFTICTNSTYTNITCVAPTIVPITASLGQRCQSNSISCTDDLYCGPDYLCRPRLSIGQNCLSSACQSGLYCDLDLCIVATSKPVGAHCSSNSACATGSCIAAQCSETHNIACYSNQDCPAQMSCLSTSNNALGTCNTAITDYTTEYNLCIATNCNTAKSLINCSTTTCLRSYIKMSCASACSGRSDAQYSGDNYQYDCTALTRTSMNNVCGYRTSFINCPN